MFFVNMPLKKKDVTNNKLPSVKNINIHRSILSIADKHFSEIRDETLRFSRAFLVFGVYCHLKDVATIEEIIENNMTDGNGDYGCDAIYLNTLEQENELIIYQSSISKKFELNKFEINIERIVKIVIDSNFTKRNQLEDLNDNVKNVLGAYSTDEGGIKSLKFDTLKIVLLLNFDDVTQIEKNKERCVQLALDYGIEVEFITINELNNLIAITKAPQNFTCELEFKPLDIATEAEKYEKTLVDLRRSGYYGETKGLYGALDALKLCKILEESEKYTKNKYNIISQNIRSNLGSKKNKHIFNTLQDANLRPYFVLLNNGVTIACDSFNTRKRDGKWSTTLKNPQIINGAQTSFSLYDYYKENDKNKEHLKDVNLLVRIYEIENNELINKIIVGANTQTALKAMSFLSNTKFAFALEKYLSIHNIKFNRKIGNLDNGTPDLEDVVKYWVSIKSPTRAKNIGSVLSKIYDVLIEDEKLKNGASYLNELKTVTDKDNLILHQFAEAYKIFKFVEAKILQEKQDNDFEEKKSFLKYSKEILTYGIYQYKTSLHKDSNDYLEAGYNYALNILTDVVKKEEKDFHKFLKSEASTDAFDKIHKENLQRHNTKGIR
jgi:uncharacterized protein YbcV (DUF1398 family)